MIDTLTIESLAVDLDRTLHKLGNPMVRYDPKRDIHSYYSRLSNLTLVRFKKLEPEVSQVLPFSDSKMASSAGMYKQSIQPVG